MRSESTDRSVAASVHEQLWVVQKFGGTSVGKYPLSVVENAISLTRCKGHRVVVVCSARSNSTKIEGTTNRLIQAYRHCLKSSPERSHTIIQSVRADHINAAYSYIVCPVKAAELVTNIDQECAQLLQLLQAIRIIGCSTSAVRDKIISSGERLACHFLSALLCDRAIPSEVVDITNMLPASTSIAIDHGFYSKIAAEIARRIEACTPGTVPVVTGFFGPVEGGVLAKVGRGYTDVCASMIAVGLGAKELQIWKEVEGMFTADPGKVPAARMLAEISSVEAAELTFHGSEVIHYTAMRLVMQSRIPLRIKNVMNPTAPGTLIADNWKGESASSLLAPGPDGVLSHFKPVSDDDLHIAPLAVTAKNSVLLINIRAAARFEAHTFFAGIFSVLDRWSLSIDLICTSEIQISMALHSESSTLGSDDEGDLELEKRNLECALAQLQEYGHVDLLPNRSIVSVIGRRLKHSGGVAGRMFTTLSENSINVEMISQGASEICISCVVKTSLVERAVVLLHSSLFAIGPKTGRVTPRG